MSKGFAMALVAALMFVPCTATVCAVEEQSAEAKKECCNKEGDCQCKDGKCAAGNGEACSSTESNSAGGECKGGKCAEGKCGNGCENGECDVTKCSSEGCQESDCKCAGSKCAKGETLASCAESDCRGTAVGYAECSNGDCATGKCGEDCSGAHVTGFCWKTGQLSDSSLSGRSFFGIPNPQAKGLMSDVMWQQIASELEGNSSSESPRDRIFVKLTANTEPAPSRVATAYVLPNPVRAEATRSQRSIDAGNEGETQIQYSIQIIEDREGCLSEYEALRRGVPMMCAETKTLLPAMRALDKHELIQQVSSPKIICTAGQTAELEINSDTTERDGIRLEVSGQRMDDGLMVQLAMCTSDEERNFEVRSALMVEEGQTIVLNANRSQNRQDAAQSEEPAVYIVVTPEVVR